MKFSYLWLKDLVKKIPPPEKLGELLTLQFMQVEEIKKLAQTNDFVFDIDILPNRAPDASGHIGIAREIRAITGTELTLPTIRSGKKNKKSSTPISKLLSAHAPQEGVERYMLSVVSGIEMRQSPKYIKERLLACGIRSINNIVDATNYVMLETGHPAHAFDYDALAKPSITVRFARPGEPFESLDGSHFKLGARHLVITDSEGPLAIAGVKGGMRSGVNEKTKRIVLELGVFDRTLIRQTSRALNLSTDASVRFSKGISSRELDRVMERLVNLIGEVAGGTVAKGFIDIKKNIPKVAPVLVSVDKVASVLGRGIAQTEIMSILSRLSIATRSLGKRILSVTPPPWRLDIENEADVIEEVGRISGYGNISATAPHVALVHPDEHDNHAISDKVRDTFRVFGFFEMQNYSFESKAFTTAMPRLELQNPISEEFMFLRTSLVPSLLENIKTNVHNARELRFFEIGNVFCKGRKDPDERVHMSAVLASHAKADNLYFEAKGIVESFCERFGLTDVGFEDIAGKHTAWPFSEKVLIHPYHAAFIKSGNEVLGILYQIHPEAGVKVPVVAIEILMPEFVRRVEEKFEFRPIPRYPSMVRDISVIVPREENTESVMNVIEGAAGEWLADWDLFDYYEGDAVGVDQKSLAFRLIFQSPDRTLTDEEVAGRMNQIIEALRCESFEARI
ncbi:MAG: phenylalanine--tRNA ligase subunit beta [Patescibacteria group bacterium]